MNTWTRFYITLTLLLYFLAGILFSGQAHASKKISEEKVQALTFRSCSLRGAEGTNTGDPSVDHDAIRRESINSRAEVVIDYCGTKNQTELGTVIQQVLDILREQRADWPLLTLSLRNYASDSKIDFQFDLTGFDDLRIRLLSPLTNVNFSLKKTRLQGSLEIHFLAESKEQVTQVCGSLCRAQGLRQLSIRGRFYFLSFCEGQCLFPELENLTLNNTSGTGRVGGMHAPELRNFHLVGGYHVQVEPVFWRGNLNKLSDVTIPLHAFAPMIRDLANPPPYIRINASGAFQHPEAGELSQLLPALDVPLAGLEIYFSEQISKDRQSEIVQHITDTWHLPPVSAKFHHLYEDQWETDHWWNPQYSRVSQRDLVVANAPVDHYDKVGVAVVDFGFCGLKEWLQNNHYASLAEAEDFFCYHLSDHPEYIDVRGFSKYSNNDHGTEVVKTILRTSNGLADVATIPILLNPTSNLTEESKVNESTSFAIGRLRALLETGNFRVVNLSLLFPWNTSIATGIPQFKKLLKDYPEVFFIQATGNDGKNISFNENRILPLSLQDFQNEDIPNLIGVAGLRSSLQSDQSAVAPELLRLHPNSNFGPIVEFAAPYLTVDAANRTTFQGTSNAAPIITGELVRILTEFYKQFGFYPCPAEMLAWARSFGRVVYDAGITSTVHARTLEVDAILRSLSQMADPPFAQREFCQ